MRNEFNIRILELENGIEELVQAGLSGDRRRVELQTASFIRKVRVSRPDFAARLASVLGSSVNTRGAKTPPEPPPVDRDEGLSLLRTEDALTIEEPVFSEDINAQVDRFLKERKHAKELLVGGLFPSSSLLLVGHPGTGKTMLSRWIARELNLKLYTLDLATSISSLLGKTGSNIRRILDFAKAKPCVLLLDEFDAIAKRRDDSGELGELKRIVNVLLKELEIWNSQSVLIAATNFPDLLDPAVNRRFDLTIKLPPPTKHEIERIILNSLGGYSEDPDLNRIVSKVSAMLEGSNASAVAAVSRSAMRSHILDGSKVTQALVREVVGKSELLGSKAYKSAAILLKQSIGLSNEEISQVLGKSPSTIHYYFNGRKVGKNSGKK